MSERLVAPYPTNSLAGSWARVQVYAERWQAGYAIFNPSDNTDILNEYETRLAPVSGIRVIAMPKQRHSLSNALC